MLNFEMKVITSLLFCSFSSITLAQVVDSTLPRPNGGPSIAPIYSTNSSDLNTKLPTKVTVTEYLREVCPTGLTGPDGTNTIIVSQRHITTYKANGNIVGVSETDWEDVDQDCIGREVKDLACPINQRGVYQQERRKVTNDNGSFEYSPWNDFINSCDYYKISDSSEIKHQECPTNYIGIIIEQRGFEIWSDGSNRNYGNWFTQSNTCKREKKPGTMGLVSATGVTFGRNGFHVGTLSLDYQTSRLLCSGSFSSYNNTPGDRPTQTTNGPFRSEHASCSLSDDGLSGVVSGDCDSTSGGDADYCMGATKAANIESISEDQCIVIVNIPISGHKRDSLSINTCL